MKKIVDLRIPPGQHTSTMQAAARVLDYLALPAVVETVTDWPRMPREVRDEVVRRYPLFGRLAEIGRLFGDDAPARAIRREITTSAVVESKKG